MHLEYQARKFEFIRGPYNHCQRMRTLFFDILHSYLRDQGVGLSDMGSSANDLTKIPKQGGIGQ
jgi:hypothetical protein